MKYLIVLLSHLLTTLAKLMGPGGAKAVVADSLPMKQQLLVINRARQRAPNLTVVDRLRRMFDSAISGMGIPKYLSSDNDPLFTYHRWLANLRILDVEEIKSVPYTPTSHPFVERLIGTVRREYLDGVLFWNASDLQRKLDDFRAYYNVHRVHSSLDGHTPAEISRESVTNPIDLDKFSWQTHCRGLYQLPVAA